MSDTSYIIGRSWQKDHRSTYLTKTVIPSLRASRRCHAVMLSYSTVSRPKQSGSRRQIPGIVRSVPYISLVSYISRVQPNPSTSILNRVRHTARVFDASPNEMRISTSPHLHILLIRNLFGSSPSLLRLSSLFSTLI